MRRYRIKYLDRCGAKEIKEIKVRALCDQDAIDWFFAYIGGFFLECEFLEWV